MESYIMRYKISTQIVHTSMYILIKMHIYFYTLEKMMKPSYNNS